MSTWQGVAVTRDGLYNETHPEMCQEIIVDSVISQSRHVDLGRELQPWVPDDDDPKCPELDNVFDETWNRCILYFNFILKAEILLLQRNYYHYFN